jgi:hypothetical protein
MVGKFLFTSNNGRGQVFLLQNVNYMIVEPPLGICGTAAAASLSVDNIVVIFFFMMNCIITNHILGNFVTSTVFKFSHPIDDIPSRLMLQLKFLATMFFVRSTLVDKLSHEQVAQHSYVNVAVKQVEVMYKYFIQVKLKH